jgi:TolB protein
MVAGRQRIVFAMKTAESDWNIYSVRVDGSDVRQLTHGSAWDPAWPPDGKSIAFVSTVEGKRQISTVSAEGLKARLVTSGPTAHFHPAFSPDGKRIALASVENAASGIAAIDSSGMNSKPATPIEQRSQWPAWSSVGKRIAYFVQGSVSEIQQVDANTFGESQDFVGNRMLPPRRRRFHSGLHRGWLAHDAAGL